MNGSLTPQYRPEIDGLRAIAVVWVILFHAGVPSFSGGYIGVDIFFVISGYLITSIILASKRDGVFTLAQFYERRARRILPALFFVLFVCVVLAWSWSLPDDLLDFSKSLVSVATFSSNLFFWSTSDYFDINNDLKPLLHTWSLAIEEQYYVVFPLFLIALWTFGRRFTVMTLSLLSVVSLGLAEWGSVMYPVATFYLLPARAWELLIGALIAFRPTDGPKLFSSRIAQQAGSGLGLSCIVFGLVIVDRDTPFPGFLALLPIMGAALIIIFADGNTVVGRILGSRPFVGVGLISYSAYLWHQPLFAFLRQRTLVEPGVALLSLATIATFVFAYFSWRFVERPFRHGQILSRKAIFRFSVAGTVAFVCIGLLGCLSDGFGGRFNNIETITRHFDRHTLRHDCDRDFSGNVANLTVCPIGSPASDTEPTVALFGDSHAHALMPAFDALGKKHNKTIAHLGVDGCPPLLDVDVKKGNFAPGVCVELAARQFEYAKKHTIKKVFLAGRWSLYTDGVYENGGSLYDFFLVDAQSRALDRDNSRAAFVRSMAATIKAYNDIGAEVVVVFQVPHQSVKIKNLYLKIYNQGLNGSEEASLAVRKASIPVRSHVYWQSFNRQAITEALKNRMGQAINLDVLLCDATICPIGDASLPFYRDPSHLSTEGALRVTDAFEEHFR